MPDAHPDLTFIVVCTDMGTWYLATRRVFATRDEADIYARSVNESRSPLVVAGRFGQLRVPGYVNVKLDSYKIPAGRAPALVPVCKQCGLVMCLGHEEVRLGQSQT